MAEAEYSSNGSGLVAFSEREQITMHSILIPVAVLSSVLLFPLVQWGRTPVDLSKLGPQVGQRVPDFNLKDQNGKSWTLDSIMGPNGVMLVFYRSADW